MPRIVCLLILLILAAPAVHARGGPTAPAVRASDRRLAVERGTKYLVGAQKKDGSWGQSKSGVIGITSLCMLAFFSRGYQVNRPPNEYRAVLDKGLKYLLARSLPASKRDPEFSNVRGLPTGYVYAQGDADSRMHGHGYATQVFILAYGTVTDTALRTDLKRKIRSAINVIEYAQQSTGGWGYAPNPATFHEGSVTVTAVQALRLAADAGFVIDKEVHKRGLKYLRDSQKSDGSFKYALHEDRSSAALTAAAITALHGFGEYYSSATREGLAYLRERYRHPQNLEWTFYSNYYAAQAMYRARGESWALWKREAIPYIVSIQNKRTGAWTDRHIERQQLRQQGKAYATSMSILALSVQDGYLPLFHR